MDTQIISVQVMTDSRNNCTFKKFWIEGFLEMNMHDTTPMLLDTYSEHLSFNKVSYAEIEYTGYLNKDK